MFFGAQSFGIMSRHQKRNNSYFSKGSVNFWRSLLVPKADGVDQPEEVVPLGPGRKDTAARHRSPELKNRV